jgi:hypothetical protein
MYVIYASDEPIYAATDPRRYARELAKYASASNVRGELYRRPVTQRAA